MNTLLMAAELIAAFALGGFVAIKSLQLGLRWQIQTERKQEPEIKPIIQPKPSAPIEQYSNQQLKEWMFGGDK